MALNLHRLRHLAAELPRRVAVPLSFRCASGLSRATACSYMCAGGIFDHPVVHMQRHVGGFLRQSVNPESSIKRWRAGRTPGQRFLTAQFTARLPQC